jgi:hypothetical protein
MCSRIYLGSRCIHKQLASPDHRRQRVHAKSEELDKERASDCCTRAQNDINITEIEARVNGNETAETRWWNDMIWKMVSLSLLEAKPPRHSSSAFARPLTSSLRLVSFQTSSQSNEANKTKRVAISTLSNDGSWEGDKKDIGMPVSLATKRRSKQDPVERSNKDGFNW